MRHSIYLLVLALGLSACGQKHTKKMVAFGEIDYSLTILHSSENHGQWEPFGTPSHGGITRRATLIKQVRAEEPRVLLLDSGDTTQGTLFYSYYLGAAGREIYNFLNYDVVAIGNHEFDNGPYVLAENFVSGAKFPIVCANIDFSRVPILRDIVKPYVILERGGRRIGVIGVVTPDTKFLSRPGDNIRFLDLNKSVALAIDELQGKGVDIIIVNSHLGMQADIELGREVPGIDIITSGHSDTLLGDPSYLPEFMGKPDGPYPTIVQASDGLPTLIVHAKSRGAFLGRLDVEFNNSGDPQRWKGRPIFVSEDLPEDPEMVAKLAELREPLDKFENTTIANVVKSLDGDRRTVRNRESNLGNLIADAMLWATSSDETTIAMINGGGIRASIPSGKITRAQVFSALPFGNTIVQIDLLGSDIRKVLEHAASGVNFASEGESGGGWLHVSGMLVEYDLTKPIGSRLVTAKVRGKAGEWVPLEADETYRIATSDYIQSGGDGYESMKHATGFYGGYTRIADAVIAYLQDKQVVDIGIEKRTKARRPQSMP